MAGFRRPFLELRPLIAAIGVKLVQERIQAEQRAHQQQAAIPVLDIGGMDDRVRHQSGGVYQEMALLSLDALAGIVARRVDANPSFSALLTLWLSMMAAVGLASRPDNSRHFSYSAW